MGSTTYKKLGMLQGVLQVNKTAMHSIFCETKINYDKEVSEQARNPMW